MQVPQQQTLQTPRMIRSINSTNAIANTCSKCVMNEKSRKQLLQSRGRLILKKCERAGNRNFDHTWVEGIKVCKGKFDYDRDLQLYAIKCFTCRPIIYLSNVHIQTALTISPVCTIVVDRIYLSLLFTSMFYHPGISRSTC